jgi:hypothetical protein
VAEGENSEKRKPHNLYEPTESMVASQREFDRRRSEIRPEDDPFWEQRGGKCAKHLQRYDTLPEKPPKSLKDCVEMITPLPNNSRLLTPTQATIFASYHKEEAPKGKHITALPTNSHLLTPTKASSLGEYHPPAPPREKQSTPRSNSGEVSAASQTYSPPINSRLLELTTNRKCAVYEKKIIDADPREDGWKSLVAPLDPRSPLPSPREVVPHENPYKEVKSKLFNQTIASMQQQWHAQSVVDEDFNGQSLNGQEEDQRSSVSVSHERASRRHQNRFSQIHSRLHEPTAAHIASQWRNRPPSPATSVSVTGSRRQSAPGSGAAECVPAVQAKTTQAQLLYQRAKYVPPDDGDIAKRAPPGGTRAGQQRSRSVPVLGRIYAPPRPPPVTERKRTSWRSPPASHNVEPAQSPYAALVNDTAHTPVVRRAGRGSEELEPEESESEDRERESRLSRLFPEVTRAIETLPEETNPILRSLSSESHPREEEGVSAARPQREGETTGKGSVELNQQLKGQEQPVMVAVADGQTTELDDRDREGVAAVE